MTALASLAAPPLAVARSSHFLHPGRLWVSAEPCTITTILGSCVAVGLVDPVAGVGGINHFLLPAGGAPGVSELRYADTAVPALLARVLALGARRGRLRVTLYGGACVLEAFRGRDNHLGAQNSEAARRLLRLEGLSVAGEDVGGMRGRKLQFRTDDGSARVNFL